VPKDAYLQREQQSMDQEGQLATGKSRLQRNCRFSHSARAKKCLA
jgi:hypothetical protein